MHKELTHSSVEVDSDVVRKRCTANIEEMKRRNQKDYIEYRDKICKKYRKSRMNRLYYWLSGSSILEQTNENIMEYLFKYRRIKDDDMMSIHMYRELELQYAFDYLHNVARCDSIGFYEEIIQACKDSKSIRLSVADHNRIFW